RRRRATAGGGGRFGLLRPAVVRLTVLRLTGGGGAHVGLLSRGFQPIGRGATRRIGWCGSDPVHFPQGAAMSSDRVVLVTGGNRGIGRAVAGRFLAAGYKVAVTARSGAGPEGALTGRADVTDAAAMDAAFTEVEQQLGPVTIVVANAGITKDMLLLRMTEDDFDSVVETNLGGTFRVVKRTSKGMLRAR